MNSFFKREGERERATVMVNMRQCGHCAPTKALKHSYKTRALCGVCVPFYDEMNFILFEQLLLFAYMNIEFHPYI